jgi:RND family efflux transporter MFP subunit
MTNKLKIAGIVLALVLLAAVMAQLAGLFGDKVAPGRVEVTQEPVAGSVVTVTAGEEAIIEAATGTVRSRHESVLSARITASVLEVPVSAGDSVVPGDILVALDDRDLRARWQQQQQAVAVAAAKLAEAEPSYARVESLFARRAVSKADLDRAEAQLAAARAELSRARRAEEEAETALTYGTIRSPVAARVIDRLVDPGDTATPGQPLLRLYDPDQLRLEANVRESLATRLERGQRLTARIDALEAEFPVTIEEIVPSADPGSRSFVVKARLPADTSLFPGMFGRLLIPHGTVERYYVPERAVARVGQLEFVNVVGDSGVVRRYVRTGTRASGDRVEVLSGLKPGERVVVPPLSKSP